MDLSNLVESPLDTQKKPYWQVLQEHQQALKDYPELAGTTVQEFAQSMGPGYEAGTGADNALRRGSGNIDIALHHFGGGAPGYEGHTLSETLGGPKEGWDLPKLVGGAVKTGAEKLGASPELTQKLEQVGEGFPRMGVDIGVGGALGGIPGIAAMSGARTYGETGSKLQAGISGLSALLIPKAAEKVGGLAMRAAGAKTLAEGSPDLLNKATRLLANPDDASKLGDVLDPNVLQRLAGVVGAQAGMFGVGEATEAAQNLTSEGTTQEKIGRIAEQFSPSSLVATGFAQLPWAIHDLTRVKPNEFDSGDRKLLRDLKTDFAKRYINTAVQEQDRIPGSEEVKSAINRVESGKTANDPDWNPAGEMFYDKQGQILQSMGQVPIEIDTKRPLRTNTGDWAVPDAVEAVKATASQLLTARPELGIEKLGDAHDQRIASALKVVEQGSGGSLSKEEMARQASLKVVDSMTRDSEDLGDISPEYADLEKDQAKFYERESEKNQKDAEIVGKLDPNSPTYDPETAKRMSILSGNVPERQAAGATPRTDLFKEPKQPILVQMPGKNGRTIKIDDSLIAQIIRDLSGNPNLRPPLTGDATARARRAADDYNGTVDVNDPASMGRFYNYIRKAVVRAQLGFNRVRGPEPGVTDGTGKGKVLNFPNEDAATAKAEELNTDNQDETVRFEPRKNPDNTYRVVRAEYMRNLSSTPTEEAGRRTGVALGEEDRFEPLEGMGGEEEEGIAKTTLDEFAKDTKEAADRNAILEQFHALSLERDPAVREARNEAMTRNLINFVKAMPDGKIRELLIKDTEGKNVPSLEKAAERKATFVKIMQFLRDKGDLKLEVTPLGKDRVSVKGRGNLDALNRYLGEHGFKDPNALNAPKMRGLSVFEQFHVLAKYLSTEFINPNKIVDFTQLPRGDGMWMPHGAFKNETLENELLISWPKDYPKGMKFTPSEHQEAPETVFKLQTRTGGEKRIESKYPLADLFVKATKHQLTISAGELHDMFKRHVPGADQKMMDLLKAFVSQPFGSTIRIGFGIAKDGRTKGYYHLDDLLTGTGILLSPFSETDSPRHIRSVDRPEDVLPHLVHELAHAHTIFGYHNDPAIKAEVQQVWKQISDYHKAAVGVGAEGKFTVDNMHSLRSPEELLASVFNDGLLHEYLKSIPDDSIRGGRNQQFNSVFDHIMDIIRRVFAKIVGPDGANTMLQRVTDLAQRTMQAQEGLGATHEGDIYSAINKPRGERLVGDLVHDTRPEPVPPVGERAQVYPQDVPGVMRHPGEPEPSPTDASTFDVAEAAKQDAKDLVHRTRRLEQVSPAYAQTRRDVLPAAVERIGQLPPGVDPILLSRQSLLDSMKDIDGVVDRDGYLRYNIDKLVALPREEYMKKKDAITQFNDAVKASGKLHEPGLGEPALTKVDYSKVPIERDKDGYFTVYHGTGKEFEKPNTPHVFFTRDYELASIYAREKSAIDYVGEEYGKPQVIASKIKLDHPASDEDVYQTGRELHMLDPHMHHNGAAALVDENPHLKEALIKKGFDGVIAYSGGDWGGGDSAEEILPFSNKGIKWGEKGILLESRMPKQPLLDSMKAASEYVTEDKLGQWFKPLSVDHFQRVFGPIFGSRLVKEDQGGQVGFRASPVAFANVTDADLARAPKPPIKTWASSAHEMMKSLFMKNGESDLNAEALAGYNMVMASLLRGTDNAIWSQVSGKATGIEPGSNKVTLGVALMPEKIGGLTTAAATRLEAGETLRHEQTHLAGFVDTNLQLPSDIREAIRTVNEAFARLNPGEQNTLLDSLTNLSDETKTKTPYMEALRNHNEFASEFMAHVGAGLGNVLKPNAYVKDLMRFLPDDLSHLLAVTTLRRAQALDGLYKVTEQTVAERYGIKYGPIKKAIGELASAFKSMGREAMDIALDQADFYRMRNLYPDMYKELVKTSQTAIGNIDRPGYLFQSREPELFKKAREAFGFPTDPRLPTKTSWWNRNVAQITQFADDYPIARPFVDMMFAARGIHNNRLVALETAIAGAFTGGKLLDDQRTKQILKLATTQRLRDLLSKIALDVNTEGDKSYDDKLKAAGGDVMQVPEINIMTPAYMDAIYRKYGATPDDRATLDTALSGIRNQIKLTSATLVDSHMKGLETVVAKAVARATNLLPEPAREVAKLISTTVKALDAGDHQTALQAQNEFLAKVPDQVVAEKLFTLMNDGWQRVKQLERFLSVRMPYFMSERRTGDYGLWWRDKSNKLQSMYFREGAQRDAFIKRNDVQPIRQTNPGDANYGVPESVFSQLNDIQAKMKEKLTDILGAKDAEDVAQVMDMATELRNVMATKDVTSISAKRRRAKSREHLDMLDTHLNYVNSVATAARNKQMKLEADLLLDTPEFRNQPVIKQLLNDHLNNVIKPDTKLGQFVSMVNFVYFMGMNLSSMILEPFQQISALAPMLTRQGATVKDSYAHLAWANKAVIESKSNKGRYKDPLLHSLMERARADGVVDQGIIAEMDHNTDLQLINRIRAVGGLNMFTPFEMLKNRVYQAANLTRRFYGTVPAYNSEAAFAASYKMLKAQGLTGDKLYSEIGHLVRLTMLGGGKFNRPIGLFNYAPRSAAQAMWSLQSYSTSMMSMMGRMIKDATFNPKGLTPAQTAQTRKAAVQMLGTQFVLAGALGMPFAQLGLVALQKLFPDENIEAKVREFFGQFAGDDEALGGWLSNALATGVPSAFSEAPDMGSRFALNSVMGVSPYSEISLNNVIGPTASVVKNVFNGMQAGVQGNPMKTVEDLMPRGILRIWKTLEQGSSFISPASGNKLAGDLSGLEIAGRAVGFTPARVARLQDAQRLAKAGEDADSAQSRQFVDRTADLTIAGRDQEAHQAITQRALESKGLHNPVELTRAVARRVEQKTTPVDPRNFGNKQTVELNTSLKGILGKQTTGPSNLQRAQMQQEIAQRLGFFKAAPSPRSLMHSSQLDRLLEMYPHLTKPQAAMMLTRSGASSPIAQELTAGDE